MTGGFNVIVERRTGAEPALGTIVFVNSLATGGHMWDEVVAELPPVFDVVRFDQRDRGGPLGHSPFDLEDLVQDLFGVLDDAGISQAHVAGVSLGGMVALAAAASKPERIQSVVAMCCAARFRRDVWVDRGQLVRAQGVVPMVPQILDRWFTANFQQENPDTVRQYRQMLESTDPVGYAFACDLLAEADVREALPRVKVPVLVISGENDSANPIEDQKLIAQGAPNARHEILTGTAHLAPVAEPAQIARLVGNHAQLSSERRNLQ